MQPDWAPSMCCSPTQEQTKIKGGLPGGGSPHQKRKDTKRTKLTAIPSLRAVAPVSPISLSLRSNFCSVLFTCTGAWHKLGGLSRGGGSPPNTRPRNENNKKKKNSKKKPLNSTRGRLPQVHHNHCSANPASCTSRHSPAGIWWVYHWTPPLLSFFPTTATLLQCAFNCLVDRIIKITVPW